MSCPKNPAKSGNRLKMKRKISVACKESYSKCKHGLFSLIKVSENCLKVSEKTGKSQGIFKFLVSGNHDHENEWKSLENGGSIVFNCLLMLRKHAPSAA